MNTYPVEWRGKTYAMSDLTVGVKKAFCAWLKQRVTAEGIENIVGRPDVQASYLSENYIGIWWGDATCSPLVHKALQSPDGGRQLNRLLFGDSAKVLSDADLDELIREKEADKASDYMVAIRQIREVAGPKA